MLLSPTFDCLMKVQIPFSSDIILANWYAKIEKERDVRAFF